MFLLIFFPWGFFCALAICFNSPLFVLSRGGGITQNQKQYFTDLFYVSWRPWQSEFSTGIVRGTAFTEMPGEFLLQIGGEFCKKKKTKVTGVRCCAGVRVWMRVCVFCKPKYIWGGFWARGRPKYILRGFWAALLPTGHTETFFTSNSDLKDHSLN